MEASRDISRLIEIMAALRDPESGCAWDLRQTFATIAPYTLEEAYEVVDAIDRGDLADLKDELGDLLLQVVFHARMAEEAGAFAFPDVVEAITSKLIRRHPHVFGDARASTPEEIRETWNAIKKEEKARRRAQSPEPKGEAGILDDVPAPLPALLKAEKLTRRAASVGFDWPDSRQVIEKIREELAEVEAAISSGDKPMIAEEIGDLLFAVSNLARHCDVDAEGALRATNAKFIRRFRAIEAGLAARGRDVHSTSLDEMEELWADAKRAESRKS